MDVQEEAVMGTGEEDLIEAEVMESGSPVNTTEGGQDGVAEVIPSTPVEDGRRKSGRPRKPAKPKEVVTEKKKSTHRKKSVAASVPPVEEGGVERHVEGSVAETGAIPIVPEKVTPAKKTPKRKLAQAEGSQKKKRVEAPLVVDISGPADLPPITAGEGELATPVTEKPIRKKKFVPADVPPIECLTFWTRKVKKVVKRPHIVPMTAAPDIPPTPTEDSEVVIVVEPVEAPVEVVPSEPVPVEEIAGTPADKRSKKRIQQDAFRKTQPSVLNFFASKPASTSPLRGDVDVDVSRSSSSCSRLAVAGPSRRILFTVSTPDLPAYAQVWKESRKNLKCKNRLFIIRPKGEAAREARPSELVISSKTLTVYGGDSLNARTRSKMVRPVYIAIHDRERPPVKLIMTHQSRIVNRRRPLAADALIDYEKDSDEEWEDEKEGEDLSSNVDAEEEAELAAEEGSEADSFFVSDGHFSDADELSDDEAVVARRRRQEMSVDEDGKATLQMVAFGPAELENLDTADYSDDGSVNVRWFKLLRDDAGITILDADTYFKFDSLEEEKKTKKEVKPEKLTIDWVPIRPELARFIHGKASNVDSLSSEFKQVRPELSGNSIKTEIRSIAAWIKRPEIQSRVAWYVKPDLLENLGLLEEEMNALAIERKVVKEVPATAGKENQPLFKQTSSTLTLVPFKDVEDREVVRN